MLKKQSKNKNINALIPTQRIYHSIYMIRGQRVMLDEDLANLYGVKTKVFNQAIRRNKNRFPEGFMFQLSITEFKNLKSQIVTSSWGGRRKRPLVFTEHGTVMLASILRSKRAVQVSIEIVKAFIQLRQILTSHKNITEQLTEIRSFMLKQSNKTDREFKKVWRAIEDLTNPPDKNLSQPIGFRID
ncbi:MAG: ORF6N domain-containing protein [Patescibacteria group bacterium]